LRFEKLLTFLAILACAISSPAAETNPPKPIAIDLQRYAGVWYELARVPNRDQDNTPTRNGKQYSICKRTKVTYSVLDPKSLSLQNTCVRTAGDGSTFSDNSAGVAKIVDGSAGNHLQIAFGSPLAQFFQRLLFLGGFDYWIFAVGDEGVEKPYKWALVSRPQRDYVFLLTRDPVPSPETRTAILAATTAAGIPTSRLVFAQE
jgi:apolipoprotein D and lipocalin family protein